MIPYENLYKPALITKYKRKEESRMIKTKKAISPIITTVLLVLLALILAIIILLWARGFVQEPLIKFDRPIEEACSSVGIQASITGSNDIAVNNIGDIPIYKLGVRISGAGASEIETFDVSLDSGSSINIKTSSSLSGAEVQLVPILLGSSEENATKEYRCPKSNWQTLV